MKQLIIGGARSGKSSLAESQATDSGKTIIYFATADRSLNDGEMEQRISHHQARRPAHWQTAETTIALANALKAHSTADNCILVDCLTLWLSNCLMSDDNTWDQQRTALLDTLPSLPGDIIFVGNEVGSGVIPMGELSRRFVDENGFLHQAIAELCDRVIFTAAGLPLVMKGSPL